MGGLIDTEMGREGGRDGDKLADKASWWGGIMLSLSMYHSRHE